MRGEEGAIAVARERRRKAQEDLAAAEAALSAEEASAVRAEADRNHRDARARAVSALSETFESAGRVRQDDLHNLNWIRSRIRTDPVLRHEDPLPLLLEVKSR
jgi:hypothetical protein